MAIVKNSWYVREPDLLFGGGGRCVDPRVGLRYFGPVHLSESSRPRLSSIGIGIVGSGLTVDLAKDWIDKCRRYIKAVKLTNPVGYDFPGIRRESSFQCDLVLDRNWIEVISEKKLNRITEFRRLEDFGKRVDIAVSMFIEAMNNIAQRIPKPDVVLCALPDTVIEYCVTGLDRFGRLKRKKLSGIEREDRKFEKIGQKRLSDFFLPLDYLESQYYQETHYGNLRRALKAEAMKLPFKNQIVWPETMRGGHSVQEDAIRAWNFCVALYYKAGGYLWRLADVDPGTCFIGISFFYSLQDEEPYTQTSMAQIFPYTGGGIVMKGGRVEVDPHSKEPRLSQSSAEHLIQGALNLYEQQMHHKPSRVVIHKTTRFSGDEQTGFLKALSSIEYRDLVTLETLNYRFYRMGKYPPLRGTAIELADNSCLIFTKGYVPFLKTYPGPGAPRPLTVLEHYGDSSMKTIVEDIIGLTKMNWNSSDFSCSQPVTIAFSRKVGEVLSELKPGIEPNTDYSYYM